MSSDKIDDSFQRRRDRLSSMAVIHSFETSDSEMEENVVDLTGPIQMKAYSIRKETPIDWDAYVMGGIISQDDCSFLHSFQAAQSREERDSLLANLEDRVFLSLASLISEINDVSDMQKFLVMIDDMLWEDIGRIRGFHLGSKEPWKVLMPLLQWEDEFVRSIGSRLISIFMFVSKRPPSDEDRIYYLKWLKNELNVENEYLISVVRCLQKLLRSDDYRLPFMALSGIFTIVRLLSTRLKPQAQYQLSFCLWVTSLNPSLAEKLNRSGTIPVLSEVLQSCPSEMVKIPRIIVATFRNLLEKPREIDVVKHNALVMLQCKLLNYLGNIEHKVNNSNDEEFQEDFKYVTDVLYAHFKELSSFDEYKMEVLSRQLEWSLVHNSKKFWVENAERLNENQYELVKILIDLLESSKDNVVLCVAAHDLGEYMKQHGRGKKAVEDFGGKEALIQLLGHRHPTVKHYVLKCLQILMLNNYELFAKYQDATEKWSDFDMTLSWKD